MQIPFGYYDVDDGPDSQLDGYYAHIVPTIFYRWNSAISTKLKYKLGLGAGPGWMTADGDVILTREEGQPMVEFDSSGVGLAAGVGAEKLEVVVRVGGVVQRGRMDASGRDNVS